MARLQSPATANHQSFGRSVRTSLAPPPLLQPMLCTVVYLGASSSVASAAPVGNPAVVERVCDLVDLIRSEDLVVIFFYFEDLLVLRLLKW